VNLSISSTDNTALPPVVDAATFQADLDKFAFERRRTHTKVMPLRRPAEGYPWWR
jgi:hypothetical protein